MNTLINNFKSIPTAPNLGNSVLLVDDDLPTRKVTALALTCLGYSVFSVDNGEAALRFAEAHNELKLLITDISMPGMSGFELAAKLRQRNPQLGVLFCSGYPQPERTQERLGKAGCGFLAKPIGVAGLNERIKSLLNWSATNTPVELWAS